MSKQDIKLPAATSNAAPGRTARAASAPTPLKAAHDTNAAGSARPGDAAEREKKERKPREPRSIDTDLASIRDRYSKVVTDLRAAEAKLLQRLTEVRGELRKAEAPLRKIEEVIASNPTLPGVDTSGGDRPAIANPTFDTARTEGPSLTGTADYDPTRYVPPSDGPEPESKPGDLDPTAPVPAEFINQ